MKIRSADFSDQLS